jgi:hypothetical protein
VSPGYAGRYGDMSIGWQHVQGDCVAVRQEKTDIRADLDRRAAGRSGIAAPLAAVVAALPRLTLLLAALGRPFSSAGFANWCRNRGNEANLPPRSARA